MARRLADELELAGTVDGFASAACGGDILFLEAILARGGNVHVVLPCPVAEFRLDCVDIIPGADWGSRFDRVLARARTLEILGEQYASDNAMASECCGRVIIGLAERCASEKDEEPVMLALWDGRPGDAAGGTHSIVQYALDHGFKVRLMMDLEPSGHAGTRDLLALTPGTSSAIRRFTSRDNLPQHICAVVFADAVGFSKLRERDVPHFVQFYLSCAMQALQANEIVPLVKNTWGDGLYFVFQSVRDAGLFAVEFRDRILAADWPTLGLTAAPNVRVGVHAGPLYRIYDPVLGQWSYAGSQVTRAARMEPSTDPGKVFASLTFVALAAAERASEFSCHPAGRRQLAKYAGEMTLFELARR